MTYTFKLARRLAVSRDFVVLTALVLLAACMGDSTAPTPDSPNTPNAVTALQVLPQRIIIETNQRVRFRAETRNVRGPISIPIAWGATGGTINSNGTFSSATSGTFKVTGRGRGWKQSDSSVVVVVAPATDVVRISVTPDPVTLSPGATRAFKATGYRSNGSTKRIGVVWSATGGSVDPAGSYTADSTSGKYHVIAANTAGTVADTALVEIADATPAPPPPPTLAKVVVYPASASLSSGTSRQFKAYGRNGSGDSVAVSVAFRATGGTITPEGLYTAGASAGSYKVIASSSGLSDTADVTLASTPTPTPPPPTPVAGMGIPFGPSGIQRSGAPTAPFTLSIEGTTSETIGGLLTSVRNAKAHVVLNMTGGMHENYMTNGVFDRSKWDAKMATYDSPGIKSLVADAVRDGTIVGASVMDEPHVHGLGDGNTWGPPGTMTKARVDSLCAVVKRIFPSLPVGVVHQHAVFEPDKSYRSCEFIVDQYSTRSGPVAQFRDDGLAMGRRDNIGILFSMNILNGGTQAPRDGLWSCPLGPTGGRGTREPNCRMSAQQVRDYGLVLGPAGCGMLMWKYDPAFMSDPDNQRAFRDVAARLATLPGKSCMRQH